MQQQDNVTPRLQIVCTPLPRKRDEGFGRRWNALGPRIQAREVLSSQAFLTWLDTPLRNGRGGGVLEDGTTLATRRERQLVFDIRDAFRFRGAAKYSPLAFSGVGMPDDIRDALLYVQDAVARAEFGPAWTSRLRPLSVQITQMDPGDDRGDHNDLPGQGTFIGSYTAAGSGDVRVCYSIGESYPEDAPRSKRSPHRPQMVRRQDAGRWYSLVGTSLDAGTYHGVVAGDEGRLSVTFRFDIV
jgi:hypothetical protein